MKPENEEDAEYDRAARELVFEAKGQVSAEVLKAYRAVAVSTHAVIACQKVACSRDLAVCKPPASSAALRRQVSVFVAVGHGYSTTNAMHSSPHPPPLHMYDCSAAVVCRPQAGERTLTAEELQDKEAARLAALEAARLKRMREDTTAAADDDADPDADVSDNDDHRSAAVGGYAAKRARMAKAAEEWDNRQKRRQQASGGQVDIPPPSRIAGLSCSW